MSWGGTFGWILLPVLSPGLLGGAEYLRRTGGRRGWRWLALSPPLLFCERAASGLLDPATMFQGGIGGERSECRCGMAGGYALSGRGPRWARISCGLLFATMIPIWALTVPAGAGSGGDRAAWRGHLYYWSLMIVLALACAIPHRAIEQTRSVPS